MIVVRCLPPNFTAQIYSIYTNFLSSWLLDFLYHQAMHNGYAVSSRVVISDHIVRLHRTVHGGHTANSRVAYLTRLYGSYT